MWQQILTILWAQFRTMRNHLPRTSIGSILVWTLSLLWYGMFIAGAVLLASFLPRVPLPQLRHWLSVGLLGMFAYWQLMPLFTLSSGWSLQLNKLQIYPVSNKALFGIEVLLRITSAPEMLVVLAGACIGLLRHPHIAPGLPLFLLLFIPLNLCLSLAIRELVLHSFSRSRFRELGAIVLITIAVGPQVLLRTSLGHKAVPYLYRIADATATPWHEFATLSLGPFSFKSLLVVLIWIALCYRLSRWQFERSLMQEDSFRPGASPASANRTQRFGFSTKLIGLPARLFPDPTGAIVQKEFQSLLRTPRFRVIFGMACVFSIVIFLPMTLDNPTHAKHSFMRDNFLVVATLYGVLLMSDILLLNIFGLDRRAAQIYFVTPISLKQVIRAKNLVAIAFLAIQCLVVLALGALVRISVSPVNILNAALAAAVVGLFFLCVGNLTSVNMPRPIDASQTFKKQAGGKMQLWFFACSIAMAVLLGLAFLARWALDTNLALLGVLLVELVMGLIVYRVATDSAVEHALRDRERLLEKLSKGPSPVGLGAS